MAACKGTITVHDQTSGGVTSEKHAQRLGSEKVLAEGATGRTSVAGTVHKDGTLHVRITRDGHLLLHVHVETPEHSVRHPKLDAVDCTLDGVMLEALLGEAHARVTVELPVHDDG